MTIQGIITATHISTEVNNSAFVKDIITPSSVHDVYANFSVNSAGKMMLTHDVTHMVVMED